MPRPDLTPITLGGIVREYKGSDGHFYRPVPVLVNTKGLQAAGLAIDQEQGIVPALVSVTDLLDEVDDIIHAGAYAKTLRERTPKGVWSHDWDVWVSKTLDARELMPNSADLPVEIKSLGGGALLVVTQFNLKTQAGHDAFENVLFFDDECQWSIGYNVPPGGATYDQKSNVRHIKELELYEYSPVLFGAMPLARTYSIKSALAAKERGEEIPRGRDRTEEKQLGGEEKQAVPGSFEQRQEALSDAIRGWATGSPEFGKDSWGYPVATFADRVVANVYSPGGKDDYLQFPYTWDGSTVALGTPEPVKVSLTISPDEKGSSMPPEAKASANRHEHSHSHDGGQSFHAHPHAHVGDGAYDHDGSDAGDAHAHSHTQDAPTSKPLGDNGSSASLARDGNNHGLQEQSTVGAGDQPDGKSIAALFAEYKAGGNAQALVDWFNDGAGGRITWADDGALDQAVTVASAYMSAADAKGFSLLRQHEVEAKATAPGVAEANVSSASGDQTATTDAGNNGKGEAEGEPKNDGTPDPPERITVSMKVLTPTKVTIIDHADNAHELPIGQATGEATIPAGSKGRKDIADMGGDDGATVSTKSAHVSVQMKCMTPGVQFKILDHQGGVHELPYGGHAGKSELADAPKVAALVEQLRFKRILFRDAVSVKAPTAAVSDLIDQIDDLVDQLMAELHIPDTDDGSGSDDDMEAKSLADALRLEVEAEAAALI